MTDTEIRALLDSAERTLSQRFLALEETERTNFARVMEAFRAEHVAVRHFAPTTGYGYGDDGRDALERIFARIFGCEDALVRPSIASGTHALALCLFGLLRPGDVLAVKSIDRLGRNYDEVWEQWRLLTKEKQVDIVVLDMPLLDTRKGRNLIGTLISDIVLQLLSYVAQTEREFIHQRQAEGIAAAKARGVKFGRKPKERPAEYEHLRDEWRAGRISARAAARQLGVAHRTFMKWVEQENPDC